MTDHPFLPGRIAPGDLADMPESWPVASTSPVYSKPFLSIRTDEIVDDSGSYDRVIVEPKGAVGVVALDDDDRILLIQQYRHPVGARLLELPAGTRDVDGEPPLRAAQRELAEEGDVFAEHWEELFSVVVTPGYSTETGTLFRATGLSPVPAADRTEREAEEAAITQWWMPIDDALQAIYDGRITQALAIIGVMAELARRHS